MTKRSRTTIVLTPALFAELDAISRTMAGSALEVIPLEEMPNTIARVNYLMGSGYKDSRIRDGVCKIDLSIIQIANRIEADQVATWPRPELDFSKITPCDLYHFALWHEIGHRLHDLDRWVSLCSEPADHNVVRWLNEVRADRFAWNKVYPGAAVPRYPGAMRTKRQIDELMKRMEKLYPPITRARRPLPTDPFLAVPDRHVEGQIPWAVAA
ncbi:MAG TPA: hypothetical protein VH040_07185 [Usitatibacter sp.]|jgi:hypothetical protein|nr:hypothetical protein [Usitatibacter sp.]